MSKGNNGVKRRVSPEPETTRVAGQTNVRKSNGSSPGGDRSDAERHEHIRVAAYFLAERRGFGEGRALDDWLTAEAQVATPGTADG